jgi:hypothetical protein
MLEGCYAVLPQGFCDIAAGLVGFVIIAAIVGLVGGTLLLIVAFRQVRHLDIPEEADFFETLRLVPITVPLALDLLDLAFDAFLAGPLAWIILEAMGLKALQLVSSVEGFLPGTSLLPTLTLSWIVARITQPSRPSDYEVQVREREGDLAARLEERRAARRRRSSAARTSISDGTEARADYRDEEEFYTYDEEE